MVGNRFPVQESLKDNEISTKLQTQYIFHILLNRPNMSTLSDTELEALLQTDRARAFQILLQRLVEQKQKEGTLTDQKLEAMLNFGKGTTILFGQTCPHPADSEEAKATKLAVLEQVLSSAAVTVNVETGALCIVPSSTPSTSDT